ncbi:ORF20A [Duck aviadenovirus B]|uniref:ORF20A n=1 Tax=Duck aviadenovirus B TaxID=1534553 RepID=A0A7D5B7G1_9ADEN|nr:ORF20A [Duck aviadenovirus B]QKX94124.1 ORF20A [Duck aviadenovirus B]UZT48544.1 ORF20A [Duck adenovirus 3]
MPLIPPSVSTVSTVTAVFTCVSLFVVVTNTVLVLTAILGPLPFNHTTGIVYVNSTFTILGLVILINYIDYATRRRPTNIRRGSSGDLEEGRAAAHRLARLVSRLNPTPVSSDDEEDRDRETALIRSENSSGRVSRQSTCRPLHLPPPPSPPPPPPPAVGIHSLPPQEDSGVYSDPLDPPPLRGLFTHRNILDLVQSSDRCRAVLHRLTHAPLAAVWSANPVYGSSSCRIVPCDQPQQDPEDSGVYSAPTYPPPPYSPPIPPRAPIHQPPLVSPYAVANLY